MAQYEHLKLYKATFDFLLYFAKIMVNYQREYKYTIGERLMNTIVEAMVIIYKANSAKNKSARLEFISEVQEKVQYINILLRLSCGIMAISKDKYNVCCNYMMDIEMQLAGWKGYVIEKVKDIQTDDASGEEEAKQLQLI